MIQVPDDYDQVPNHQHFYSNSINFIVAEEKYRRTWREKGWQTLKGMLIYYSTMDCIPFIEAVGKRLTPCLAKRMEVFKTSFSVGGVAKRQNSRMHL